MIRPLASPSCAGHDRWSRTAKRKIINRVSPLDFDGHGSRAFFLIAMSAVCKLESVDFASTACSESESDRVRVWEKKMRNDQNREWKICLLLPLCFVAIWLHVAPLLPTFFAARPPLPTIKTASCLQFIHDNAQEESLVHSLRVNYCKLLLFRFGNCYSMKRINQVNSEFSWYNHFVVLIRLIHDYASDVFSSPSFDWLAKTSKTLLVRRSQVRPDDSFTKVTD